jgi:hypothetical protein
MTAAIYSNAKFLVDKYDLSGFFKSVKPTRTCDPLDKTTLASGTSREHAPGLASGTVSCEGLFDAAQGGSEEALRTALGSATKKITSIFDDNSVGSEAKLLNADETKYACTLQPAQLKQINGDFVSNDGGIDVGVVLHDLAAETTTGSSASVDNSAASTNGGVAHLHMTAISGSGASITVKVQHSVDGTTWVDLVTFTAATTTTQQRVEVTGTVYRYQRATRTMSGTTPSVTHAVAFARR